MKLTQGTIVDLSTVDYAVVKRLPNYGVVKEGHIVNLKTGRVLKHQHTGTGRGKVWAVLGKSRCLLTVSVEVARAFVPNPNNYNYVGYIDGDPANVDYRNLKWVKATWVRCPGYVHITGLPVYVTDLTTGDTTGYASIIAASRSSVQASAGTIVSRAARSKEFPLYGRYIIHIDPEELRESSVGYVLGGKAYSWDLATGELAEYPTHSYMSYVLGVPVVMTSDSPYVIRAGYVLSRDRDVAVAIGNKHRGLDPADVLKERKKMYASPSLAYCKSYLLHDYDKDETFEVRKLREIPELLKEVVGVSLVLTALRSRVRSANQHHKPALVAGFGLTGNPKHHQPLSWKAVTPKEVAESISNDMAKYRIS